jgi:prepilin-type processing-associated H-X9-DG protein
MSRPCLPSLLVLACVLPACSAHQEPAAPAPTATGPGNPAPAAAVLEAHHWTLADARDRHGRRLDALFLDGHRPVQLDFSDQRLAVSNTCNRLGGSYRLQGRTLSPGKLVSTLMACTDPRLAALDREVGSRLEGPLLAELGEEDNAPRLILATAGGDRLAFLGQPTATTRYGGPPERVFLEVAAQTRPCSHPLIADMQCLQVREVHYDQAGLKSAAPGPWQNFYDPIEGYEHRPGIRNVLRVDRYTRKDVPADASAHAWVLDLVVESEQVQP